MGAAHLPVRQGERLAVACPVAADELVEAVLRRGVPPAVVQERGPEREVDGKAVVAQDAAYRESREMEAQPAVPPQVPQAQSSQPGLAQRVLLLARELQARELPLPGVLVLLQAQVSLPQVPAHVAQRVSPLVPGQLAWPPLAGAPGQPEEQQEEQQAQSPGLMAAAKLPSPPLLSPCARLPPRFLRPPHPLDDA